MDKRREEILAKCTLADCNDARELIKDLNALEYYLSLWAPRLLAEHPLTAYEEYIKLLHKRLPYGRFSPGTKSQIHAAITKICDREKRRRRQDASRPTAESVPTSESPEFRKYAKLLLCEGAKWWDHTKLLLKQSFENAGTYRLASSRWAGGENHYQIFPVFPVRFPAHPALGRGYDAVRRVTARRESRRAWSSNGKWVGSNSEATFHIPWNWWLKVYTRRGPYVQWQDRRMLVLDVDEAKDEVAFVCPGRGFDIWVARRPCGEVKWEGQDEPGDPHRRALQRSARG